SILLSCVIYTSLTRSPPRSSLLPYPPLFRSSACARAARSGRSRGPWHGAGRARPAARRHGSRAYLATRRAAAHPPCDPALLAPRSEEHTSELQSRGHLVCGLLLEKSNNIGQN